MRAVLEVQSPRANLRFRDEYASLAVHEGQHAIFFRIVTHTPTQWPVDLFWAGIGLALLAGMFYVRTAWGEVRR